MQPGKYDELVLCGSGTRSFTLIECIEMHYLSRMCYSLLVIFSLIVDSDAGNLDSPLLHASWRWYVCTCLVMNHFLIVHDACLHMYLSFFLMLCAYIFSRGTQDDGQAQTTKDRDGGSFGGNCTLFYIYELMSIFVIICIAPSFSSVVYEDSYVPTSSFVLLDAIYTWLFYSFVF